MEMAMTDVTFCTSGWSIHSPTDRCALTGLDEADMVGAYWEGVADDGTLYVAG